MNRRRDKRNPESAKTEFIRVEESELSLSRRYESILQSAGDGIFGLDAQGNHTLVNSSAERILGYSSGELMGRHSHPIWHHSRPDGTPYPEEECNIYKTLRDGVSRHIDNEVFWRKDGTSVPVDYMTTPIYQDSTIVGTVVSFRDITERKMMEEALKDSESRFRRITSAALDAVILIDNDGNVSFWNEAATRMFGYTSKEIQGNYLHSYIMPERHVDTFRKGFEVFRTTGEGPFIGQVYETEAKRKDGTEFPAELSLAALKLKGKWSAVGVVRDISGRKNAESEIKGLNEDLRRKIAELEYALGELDAFSYSVSHDLRAPLRIINGFSNVLLDEYHDKLDKNGRELLAIIKAHLHRMDELIEGLLKLSRIGRQKLRMSDIDIGKMGQKVFDELTSDIKDRKVEYVANEMPSAKGDRVLIRQVLVNLISNALKFSRGKDTAVIVLNGRTGDGFTTYAVSDNGIGFDMKHSEKLFQVFHKLHPYREFEGTGIGLSIVQRIIERHGGRVCAEGKPKEGATFYFTLPTKK